MSADKARHDKMVSLVERMLELHKQSPKTPQEQEMVKREIESTDTEIDELVYELSEEVPKYGDVR
jgi:5-bromo-4-chloroindolyl phosphate hydrolysis protein